MEDKTTVIRKISQLNDVKYIPAVGYNEITRSDTLYCHTVQTTHFPAEKDMPVTVFPQGQTVEFRRRNQQLQLKYPTHILKSMTTVKLDELGRRGTVFEGLKLPLLDWCQIFSRDMINKEGPGSSSSIPQWIRAILPHFESIFCGVTKCLTILHTEKEIHGNLFEGIFVGVPPTRQSGKSQPLLLDIEGFKGYLGNFEAKPEPSKKSKAQKSKAVFTIRRDQEDLLKASLQMLIPQVPMQDRKVSIVEPYLQALGTKGRRLLKLLQDLEKCNCSPYVGYFYPLFWPIQAERSFLLLMHSLLFKLVPYSSGLTYKRSYDIAFPDIRANWMWDVMDPDMVDFMVYPDGLYCYQSRLCVIMFFRNCDAHVPRQGQKDDAFTARILRNMPEDIVLGIHSGIPNLVRKVIYPLQQISPDGRLYRDEVLNEIQAFIFTLLR